MRFPSVRRAAVASAVFLVSSACFTLTAQATPPSTDPSLDAEYAAAWAATQVNAKGFVPLPSSAPNVTATLETALTLGAAKVERPTFDRIVAWAQANVSTIIASQGADSPGTLGELLMITHLAGVSATSFGGVDLVAHLGDTLGDFTAGLYGAQDPTYDGVYRQSLAILGLASVGAVVPATATTWLAGQQCVGAPNAAAGGWEAYRADPAVPCTAPDPVNFTGPDTNSTAMAVQALDAAGLTGPEAAALDFLAVAESSSGGFAFVPGGDDDPNSTALVIQAIVAAGEDPTAGRWMVGTATPIGSLLTWQLGCGAPVADRGAFASPFSGGTPDAFATRQAVWGVVQQPFPFTTGSFHPAGVPCQPTTTSPSVAASPSSTSPSSTLAPTAADTAVPTAVPTAVTTRPVVATPVFTG